MSGAARILAINGSHRGDRGRTRFLIDRLLAGAVAGGADCAVATLARQRIHRCVACDLCHAESSSATCPYWAKDDVRTVFDQMAAADLIVYATPVYVFGMSGLMKTFLDRFYALGDSRQLQLSRSGLMFHYVDPTICATPFVTLVCCDNVESATPRNVVHYFRTFSRFLDAPLVGELVSSGGGLIRHGRDRDPTAEFPRLSAVHAAYEQAGRELATIGRIRRGTQRQANREILPVPLFGVLKRLPNRPLKRLMIERARGMQASTRSAGAAEPRLTPQR